MLTYTDTTATIQCDKCKRESTAPKGCYNDMFWIERWALHRGRKYEHLCYWCLDSKSRKAIDSMQRMGL